MYIFMYIIDDCRIILHDRRDMLLETKAPIHTWCCRQLALLQAPQNTKERKINATISKLFMYVEQFRGN